MFAETKLNLLQFFLALSEAFEIASPQLSKHQLRVAFITWKLSNLLNLNKERRNRLFFASLVHDLGALTPKEKIDIHKSTISNMNLHCEFGEKVLNKVPEFIKLAEIVKYHHTDWQEIRFSENVDVFLESQLLNLADSIERLIDREQYILFQVDDIRERIKELSGTRFTPEIIELFEQLSTYDDFWLDLASEKLHMIVQQNVNIPQSILNPTSFVSISEMVRDIIDFRSLFTATHSRGVATSASVLAECYGFSETEIEVMKIAGNLHDLGKMAVSNEILEKNGKLTRNEYAIIKQHPYYSYTILIQAGFDKTIAEWAGLHHEKLDGTGYPFRLDSSKLNIGARIMAVADVFTALTESRPYRIGLEREKVISILDDLCSRNSIDKRVLNILDQNYDYINQKTKEEQKIAIEYYMTEFNKENYL